MFHQHLRVPMEQMDLLRNAIGPPFERLFNDEAELIAHKAGNIRLAYTSTPFRGLNILLEAFPEIYRRHPNISLDVFSSLVVYYRQGRTDPHHGLYARCKTTPGIKYRGSLSQVELARELSTATVLAYPNTFPETSCIAVMEALAAGLFVVSSELAALPETSGGWGWLLPIGGPVSRDAFTHSFITAIDTTIREIQANPSGFLHARFQQVRSVNAACNWEVRATEWQTAASRWLGT
jgi:glycosyltransferase involved in cell wall biosynthesis